MKLKSTLLFFLLMGALNALHAQIRQEWCIQDAIISTSGGQDELYFCVGDGIPDRARFRVSPFVQPFAYLITDENNIILRVSKNNTIDFEGLGDGRLRVWAFAYLGNILAEPGQDAATAQLADICYGLTQNFIPLNGVIPDAGTVSTAEGLSSVFTCRDDGNADILSFVNTSSDPLYSYVITDESNIIIAFAEDDRFDFENLTADKVRVWGVSYVGRVQAEVGDELTTVDFASGCFDLSDNFVEVTRAQPNGGTVSLATGETTKTICAEDLAGDVLSFVSQSDAENPYAFIITDENGIIINVLNGNTTNFDLTDPGICRIYGVSYTGELKVSAGEDINTAVISDDCFDLSSNFVEIIKREVDGGTVSLTGGGNTTNVCVVEGVSETLAFETTSATSDANYVFIITNNSNVIQAVVEGNTFNFADLNNRNNRVWGLSYTGTLLAQPGVNAATAALSSECYDLSDNFIIITRKFVNGDMVTLESGAASANVCTNDLFPDVLSFRNTSTSVESYIYVVTDENGTVIGFINGDQFDFNDLDIPVAYVYGLSYSGGFRLSLGENINDGELSTECADVSDNFVTVFRKFVDGGEVALTDGSTEALVCSGDADSDVLSFNNSSTSDENYVFVVTDFSNRIIEFVDGDSYDFGGETAGILRIWGISYSGNLTAEIGDVVTQTELSDECSEVSDNFIEITRTTVDGAMVTTIDGESEVIVCTTTAQPDMLVFSNDSEAAGNYAYILTTDSNIVIETTLADAFSFTDFPQGNYRVWGVSYTGNLTILPGDDAATSSLSDECFDLSDNFVAINLKDIEGGSISLADGATELAICAGDGTLDAIDLATTSASDNLYTYLITDTTNTILSITNESSFFFGIMESGTYRIWGLSYTGDLLAEADLNAATTTLSSECFELSTNFITVTVQAVDGAQVALANGDTSAITCVAQPLNLDFANTSTADANYSYLVTDANNIVVALPTGDSYSFDTLAQGEYRVWGVSYSGNLRIQVGEDAAIAALSDDCFDLSDNFVEVTLKNVDGGTVSLMNGDTNAFACGFESSNGQFSFDFETPANADYTFIITDGSDRIFAILNGSSVSFNGVRIGNYRIYGVSYTGNLTAATGQNINDINLADECFDLSDNFVAIRKEETNGGTIATTTDTDSLTFCPGNGVADVVELTTDGNSSGDYAFVLTNDNNELIALIPGGVIDFDTIPEGNYRLWGVAFTGNILIQAGENAGEVAITDACFDLSENFISVTNEVPEGGTVSLLDEELQRFTCPNDGNADVLQFFSDGASGTGFVFLVTDENNIVEAILTENTYDFEQESEGVNRIWGLAYSGNLTVVVGDDAAAVALSDDCFDLSDNFIEVIRETPVGGDVFLQGGGDMAFICTEGEVAILQFDSTGTSRGEYIYVITDENNIIRNGIFGDQFDFSFLPVGTYRVWGLAYTGMLTATIGDTVTTVAISDECFALSTTFTTVVVSPTNGGTVATDAGATEVSLCVGDGVADELIFTNTSTSNASYAYLVTDKNNGFLTIATDGSFDFENAEPDTCRVWGLSYAGDLLAEMGDDVIATALASGCFELSANFIEVARLGVNGGMITSNAPTDTIFTCVNDGNSDLVIFSNNSTATASDYIYVLTNDQNLIRGTVSGDQFDFETAGVGVTKVWGVSYTGMFTGNFGANITSAQLSNGCFELSENFITVARDEPLGGDVSLPGGATSGFVCPSPENPTATFVTTSSRLVGYAFVVTDENNDILLISLSADVDFTALPVGTYRVWGLSYTGQLQLEVGGNILSTEPLASSCFEISSGFVEIYRSTLVDGGEISNLEGPDTLYVCPNDSADIVQLSNNSVATDAAYRYVLTNDNNVILSRNLENEVIDFNNAMPGKYRIWGISHTGTFTGLSSDNVTTAMLSDSCYEVSSNFISIIVGTPDGGIVSTADTLTEITVTLDLNDSEKYAFIAQDAAMVKYQYVITGISDQIVAFIEGDTIDFEEYPVVGTLKVWGLSYTGNIIAEVGDVITDVDLTDDCYDLSENFVGVIFPVPVTDGEPTEQAQPNDEPEAIPTVIAEARLLDVSIYPNPAINRIQVTITAERPAETKGNLRIFSLTGRMLYEENIQMTAGENQVGVQISDLPDGLYLLQVRNGNKVKTIRFLKQ